MHWGIYFIAAGIYVVIFTVLYLIGGLVIKRALVYWIINSLVSLVLSLISLSLILTNLLNNNFWKEVIENLGTIFAVWFVMSFVASLVIIIKKKIREKIIRKFLERLWVNDN
jgi:hypothetical protein